METKEFITIAKRNHIANELYVFGLIHGLQIALCDEDLEHSLDCEAFLNQVVYITNTTKRKYDNFVGIVEKVCPGLCEFDVKD